MTDKEKAEFLKSRGWKTETGKIYGWTWFEDNSPARYFLEDAYVLASLTSRPA